MRHQVTGLHNKSPRWRFDPLTLHGNAHAGVASLRTGEGRGNGHMHPNDLAWKTAGDPGQVVVRELLTAGVERFRNADPTWGQ